MLDARGATRAARERKTPARQRTTRGGTGRYPKNKRHSGTARTSKWGTRSETFMQQPGRQRC
eukprot:6240158-Lingulodinium_polyedra.AAC.1